MFCKTVCQFLVTFYSSVFPCFAIFFSMQFTLSQGNNKKKIEFGTFQMDFGVSFVCELLDDKSLNSNCVFMFVLFFRFWYWGWLQDGTIYPFNVKIITTVLHSVPFIFHSHAHSSAHRITCFLLLSVTVCSYCTWFRRFRIGS